MTNPITLLLAQTDGDAEVAGDAGAQETPPTVVDEGNNAIKDLANGDTDAAMDLVMQYGPKLLGAVLIIVLTFIIAKIIGRIIHRFFEKAEFDETLERFFAKLIYYVVLVIGLTFALSAFGVEVTSLAAVLAAAGFAVGMALSGTLSNFANGVMLLIFRPFDVGDVINAAGVTAKVNAIELFTTTLDTGDNRRIIVPNSSVYGGIIENITHHDERRCDVGVGCDYSADIDKTREVLSKAAESLDEKMLKGDGRGYQIVLGDLGDSSVNWTVRFWCLASDYWPLKEALTRAIKMHLDEAGIGIPFPQMDVHLDKVGE